MNPRQFQLPARTRCVARIRITARRFPPQQPGQPPNTTPTLGNADWADVVETRRISPPPGRLWTRKRRSLCSFGAGVHSLNGIRRVCNTSAQSASKNAGASEADLALAAHETLSSFLMFLVLSNDGALRLWRIGVFLTDRPARSRLARHVGCREFSLLRTATQRASRLTRATLPPM